MVDFGERQLLAQLVVQTAAARDVDRFGVQERLVQPIELLLDGLDSPLLLRGSVPGLGAALFPDEENLVFDQGRM